MILVKKRYLLVLMVLCFLSFTIKDEETMKTSVPSSFLVNVPQLATAIPAENNNSKKSPYDFSLLHTGKTFIGFKEALAYRESRSNYFIVNRFGYMGKYQFGKRALRFLGVTDFQQFLNSPAQQERVFVMSLQYSKWFLHAEIKQFAGKTINGIAITESGILAAAHLAGTHSVKKFFKNRGNYSFTDGNGTTLQNYLKHFAGYDTSFIVPNESPKLGVPAELRLLAMN
nr:peptidoglycan-binding protein LysM [uncultured Capnocytophaga sp.]